MLGSASEAMYELTWNTMSVRMIVLRFELGHEPVVRRRHCMESSTTPPMAMTSSLHSSRPTWSLTLLKMGSTGGYNSTLGRLPRKEGVAVGESRPLDTMASR